MTLRLNRVEGENDIASAVFTLKRTLAEGSNTNVTIGNTFAGAAEIYGGSYAAGEHCSVNLNG